MRIQSIVEGHGDVAAFPVLLRRLVDEAQVWEVDVGSPIRRPRHRLVEKVGVQQSVRLALVQPDCGGILILLDGDSDCPADVGPTVEGWAAEAAAGVPCGVVLAQKEYEAWFLASIESLRGYRGIRSDAESHPDPERPRGAKAQLEARMEHGTSYLETADQPAFSGRFSLPIAYRRSRSFRKLTDSFGGLVRAMGLDIASWPPHGWTAGG